MSRERNFVMVRLADRGNEPVMEWLSANASRNGFDPEVLDYKCTKVLAAHNNGTVYVYMPAQPVVMLESIGPNPEAKPLEVATGVMELVKAAAMMAVSSDPPISEMYFLASDELTAKGAKAMGFVELPYKVYRRKLK